MENLDFNIALKKGIPNKKRLIIHNQSSRTAKKYLEKNHKYLSQNLLWRIIELKGFSEEEKKNIQIDEMKGIRYNEIYHFIVEYFPDIPKSKFIFELLNQFDCFDVPTKIKDEYKLIFWTDYIYEDLNKLARPSIGNRKIMLFNHKNGKWIQSQKTSIQQFITIDSGKVEFNKTK